MDTSGFWLTDPHSMLNGNSKERIYPQNLGTCFASSLQLKLGTVWYVTARQQSRWLMASTQSLKSTVRTTNKEEKIVAHSY